MKVYRYEGTNQRGEGWFIAFLDDAGCFACLSDFGDWSHRWPMGGMTEGEDLRRFFLRCDTDYILRKIAPREVYDGAGTIKAIRRRILDLRRTAALSAEDARHEWRHARDHEGEIEHGEFGFAQWCAGAGIDPVELAQTKHEPQAVAFLQRVWPRLIAEIRRDVERNPAPSKTEGR